METVQLEFDLELDLAPDLSGAAAIPHPCTPQGIAADQRRTDFLDALYRADGRDQAGHPWQGTYTGLFEAFCLRLGRQVMHGLIGAGEVELVERAGTGSGDA